MALSADSSIETELPSTGTPVGATLNPDETNRTVEVPALLGESRITDSDEPVREHGLSAGDETDAPTQSNDVNQPVSTPDSFRNRMDTRSREAAIVEPDSSGERCPTGGSELKNIMESLQHSLTETHYISSKLDAVSADTDNLLKQVNSLSLNYELLAAEMESVTSGTKGKLSKMFLIISSITITLLIAFQLYTFTSLIKTEQLQNAAGSSVLESIGSLNKKMAAYDKNLTKALEKPAPQEHVLPNPVAVEKAIHETSVHAETVAPHVTPVPEKLNRLRNGLPEKKLIRKETGDWFVYNKKTEECIADVEAIETLNGAYKKIGRSLSTTVPMPAHNALCILKPDGKGGTDVVMTKVFVP